MSIDVSVPDRMSARGMTETFVMASPIGRLRIMLEGACCVQLDYDARQAVSRSPLSANAKRVKRQIKNYLARPPSRFDIKLALQGTDFQQRVWRALQKIPLGQTRTYGQLAAKLGSSARAVGNACRQNPVPLIVPCHRVVAKNGLGGFSGKTRGAPIQRKRWLLAHEGALSE